MVNAAAAGPPFETDTLIAQLRPTTGFVGVNETLEIATSQEAEGTAFPTSEGALSFPALSIAVT